MPLESTGAKLVSVPPTTSTSARLKVVLASDRTKVISSLPPAARLPLPWRLSAILGAVVSGGTVL